MPSDRPRLAIVVPRYGADVVGGAESLGRLLAEHVAASGAQVDVLTTCARDHFTWRNELPAGEERVNGVLVRRFPIEESRDNDRWWGLHVAISQRQAVSYADEIEWMANSAWSPGMHEAASDAGRYDWLLPMPYLFGTSFWTAAAFPERTALIPCVHDEPYAWLPLMRAAFEQAAGCMMNTESEQRLLARIAPAARTRVVGGVGYDITPPPGPERVEDLCRRLGVAPGFLLYAGRREEAKGLPELFAHYRALRAARPDAPALALMGSGDLQPPADIARHVVDLGFLSVEDRDTAYAAATALVHPSRLESLGMVLLEAWLAGTPAVVNGHSPVLKDHCVRSGGGLWYDDEAEFVEATGLLIEDAAVRGRLAANGRAYVVDTYSWPALLARMWDALESWS